jgi:hypothetical protein
MNNPWNISQESEENVDDQVLTAPLLRQYSKRRENHCQDEFANIHTCQSHGQMQKVVENLEIFSLCKNSVKMAAAERERETETPSNGNESSLAWSGLCVGYLREQKR